DVPDRDGRARAQAQRARAGRILVREAAPAEAARVRLGARLEQEVPGRARRRREVGGKAADPDGSQLLVRERPEVRDQPGLAARGDGLELAVQAEDRCALLVRRLLEREPRAAGGALE